MRDKWWVALVKTLNLSAKSFMRRDIQSQACALTYRTLLAIVPALALLIAIGRGFGLQQMLRNELFSIFPSQHTAINYALDFVDAYLSNSSGGLFVGIGLAFLLWTLISLVSNIERAFNRIWGLSSGRSLWRQISDYTAMMLILPVLMICSAGISLMVSSTLQALFDATVLPPLVSLSLKGASVVFTWLFFTAAYMLVPNTKVRFRNAVIAGVFAGTGFLVVQWLFVSGQMYVARYNAIYGSFSFLPLLLLWLQLTWMITLAGAVICYSSQNFLHFSHDEEVANISPAYDRLATIAAAAVITRRFVSGKGSTERRLLIERYDIPPQLADSIIARLHHAGVIATTIIDEKHDVYGYAPAIDPATLTVGKVCSMLDNDGHDGFIASFGERFPGVEQLRRQLSIPLSDDTPLAALQINDCDHSITSSTKNTTKNTLS